MNPVTCCPVRLHNHILIKVNFIMEKRTSLIILANVILFLLYIKFGSLAFWFIAVAGFVLIISLAIITLVLQVFFPFFYENKFCPGFKRITGMHYLDKTLSRDERTKLRDGIIALFFIIIIVALIAIYGLPRL